VRVTTNYDAINTNVPAAAVGIELREPVVHTKETDVHERLRIHNSFDVSYRFISDSVLQLLQARTVLRLTDRIGGIYATRYDIKENRFLENYFGVRWVSSCDCWSLDIGLSDTSNPNEVQLRAQVNLVGLGSSGKTGPKNPNY
jgi:lipopolysaccharide assembly outer membrane protein LptD (OstA)